MGIYGGWMEPVSEQFQYQQVKLMGSGKNSFSGAYTMILVLKNVKKNRQLPVK